MSEPSSIEQARARVAALGEWITGFSYQGQMLGGKYPAEIDPRVLLFIDRLRALPHETILECGCLEGGHTTMLARAFPKSTIHAVDVRPENLQKAQLLAELRECTNIQFLKDDLDTPKVIFNRTYDAIFCVGLLYHLRWPDRFLSQCAAAAPVLWLWTVYCAEKDAKVREGDFRGRLYKEPVAHPLSGVRDESFFPTLGSLSDMIWAAGYKKIELIESHPNSDTGGPAILLCASRDAKP